MDEIFAEIKNTPSDRRMYQIKRIRDKTEILQEIWHLINIYYNQ